MKPKTMIGLGVIACAAIALMVFAVIGNSSLEVRVSDLMRQRQSGANLTDRSLKLTGVVVGDSVSYDPRSLRLEFDIVDNRDELANNLARAQRMRIVYNGTRPDTLQNEAMAIVTGKLAPDGKFYAGDAPDALMLQCPTKYVAEEQATK